MKLGTKTTTNEPWPQNAGNPDYGPCAGAFANGNMAGLTHEILHL